LPARGEAGSTVGKEQAAVANAVQIRLCHCPPQALDNAPAIGLGERNNDDAGVGFVHEGNSVIEITIRGQKHGIEFLGVLEDDRVIGAGNVSITDIYDVMPGL